MTAERLDLEKAELLLKLSEDPDHMPAHTLPELWQRLIRGMLHCIRVAVGEIRELRAEVKALRGDQ